MVPSLLPDTQCLSLSQSRPNTQSAWPMKVCTGCISIPLALLNLLVVLEGLSCKRHRMMSSAALPPVTMYAPEGLTAKSC
jgi:hypothetical protein